MKKLKTVKELKIERPVRKKISEQEAIKRVEEFSKRKKKFIATVRTSKSESVSSCLFTSFYIKRV